MQQVHELIDCFPDEDEHLPRFTRYKPKTMTINELKSLLTCPPLIRVKMLESEEREGGMEVELGGRGKETTRNQEREREREVEGREVR